MEALDENIKNSIVDGLLNKFGSVTPREFIIYDDDLPRCYDEPFSTIPLIDFKQVKLIKVPSNFMNGCDTDDEEITRKMKEDNLSDGLIEMSKQFVRDKRAYHERLLLQNIQEAKLETPRDDEKIKQLIAHYTPPFFSSVYVPEEAVPPRIEFNAGRKKKKVYTIGTPLPPVSTDILLVGSFIECCIIILVEGLTASNLSTIRYAYKIQKDEFNILFFVCIQDQ
jgi:hypothetical protein